MRFNCGPSPEERKRRREEAEKHYREIEAAYQASLWQWHDWFAWRPVRVGENDCRWLETVGRRRTSRIEEVVYELSLDLREPETFKKIAVFWEYRAKP